MNNEFTFLLLYQQIDVNVIHMEHMQFLMKSHGVQLTSF
jgi:hypothetical protein